MVGRLEEGSYIEFCQERNMLKPEYEKQLLDVYNHAWNTLGALIRSLREKKSDGSWHQTYKAIQDDHELNDV